MKKTTHYTGHRWTNDECKQLMRMWDDDTPLPVIAKKLNSTTGAILKQVQRMRTFGIPLRRRTAGNKRGNVVRPWTQGDTEYLIRRRNEKATSEDIAIELGRTHNAVDAMIGTLRKEGVEIAMRGMGVRRKWSPESLKIVTMRLQ